MDKRIEEVLQLGVEMGLDGFPIVFETVDRSTMFNICAYALPIRARHWSYGRSYDHQKAYGEMGYSKVYEIILNNNPSYAFLLDTNSEVQNIFIAAHCLGHCLVPGTLVETINGPIKIEDLTESDLVLTHKGTYEKVSAKSYKKYSGSMVEIKLGTFDSIFATGNHPFYAIKSAKCTKGGRHSICKPNCNYKNQKCENKPYAFYELEWTKAEDLRLKDFIAYPRPKFGSGTLINPYNIRGSKSIGRRKNAVEVSYELKLDYDFGEFLGLFLAEGFTTSDGRIGLCFNSNEIELQNRTQFLLKHLFNINSKIKTDLIHHSTQIICFEKVLADWLRAMGVGCENKHLAQSVLEIASDEFLKGFIRGCFSGDGTNGQRQIALTTTSVRLSSQVRNILAKFGIISHINKRDRANNTINRKTSYDVLVTGSSLIKLKEMCLNEWDINIGNRSFEFGWADEEYLYLPITKLILHENINTEVINLEVPVNSSFTLFNGAITHNSHMFKNNCMFQTSDRNMIRHAAEHASRIEDYIAKYGFDKVERLMDIGFALDGHLNWSKGLYRKPYPEKSVSQRSIKNGEFSELSHKNRKIGNIKTTINDKFPPQPEKDLLWFCINYAPLEEWEQDVLDIIREEAYYFYPQMQSKIIHEGFATYWHAEIMFNYKNLSPAEYLDFVRVHERVVQAGNNPFRLNPYYIGYRIFKDIEKRWDAKDGVGAGKKKILEVAREEDDISFLRNYLTPELAEDLNLFVYGYTDGEEGPPRKKDKDFRYIEIKNKMRDAVVEAMIKPLYNCGTPQIVITGVGQENTLLLKHESEEVNTLDFRFAEKTLEYLWDLWADPVQLTAKNDEGEEQTLCFDEAGFYVKKMDSFDLEIEEEEDDSWRRKTRRIILP